MAAAIARRFMPTYVSTGLTVAAGGAQTARGKSMITPWFSAGTLTCRVQCVKCLPRHVAPVAVRPCGFTEPAVPHRNVVDCGA